MARLPRREPPKPQIQISPMIDCVFLLLFYFMVSASLDRQEADISFQLPGTVEQSEPLEFPDEQIIEIRDGRILVNNYAYDSPSAPRYSKLATMLARYKQASEANKTEATITIAPEDTVVHQTIVKVMDACSIAGISNVNFALEQDS